MKISTILRLSESPFVERVWESQTEQAGEFNSVAVNQWSLVVWEEFGQRHIAIRGPETRAVRAPVPENSYSFGVDFKLGTFMPHLPVSQLVDQQIDLPPSTGGRFWLNSSAWELPTFENVDTFVHRLVREGILIREPIIEASLRGQVLQDLSLRTTQRKFLHATGITQTTVHQIERARYATMLLQSGVSILDTIEQAGYYDQPHLTRLLKRYIGQTPAQLADSTTAEPMSFLYKTLPIE